MLGAGFYTNTDALVPADGIAVFTLDSQGKATNTHYYEIPEDVRKQYGGDAADNELNHMAMQECIFLEDGGMLLVGEQTYYDITASIITASRPCFSALPWEIVRQVSFVYLTYLCLLFEYVV
jgi:hypothetical protein